MQTKSKNKKAFWKNIQPLFPENRKLTNKINLKDSKENTLFGDILVPEELNRFFQNSLKS